MKKITYLLTLFIIPFTLYAQNEDIKMHRTLDELVYYDNLGWSVVSEWIDLAKNKVEILPADRTRAEITLEQTQVTTRSLMGAIIYETGGLLIEDGLIRILGSGCDEMQRSLSSWNKGKTFSEYGEIPPYLLIADDAIGGFYALNGGYFGEDKGKVYYNSPNSLEWESLGIEYSQFLLLCFETDLPKFYEDLSWEGWLEDIKKIKPDYSYIFTPLLFTKEGADVDKVSRKAAPIEEAYNFNMDMKATFR